LSVGDGVYKIGVSKNVEKRVKQLQTGNPETIEIVDTFLSDYPYKIENVLHRRYKHRNIRGECFSLSLDEVKNFKEDCIVCETNFKLLDDYNNDIFYNIY
jgi:hypothetical protein